MIAEIELMWTGTKHNLSKIPGRGLAVTLHGAYIAKSDDVRIRTRTRFPAVVGSFAQQARQRCQC